MVRDEVLPSAAQMADEARILAEELPGAEPHSGVGAQLEDEEQFRAEAHSLPLAHLRLPADFHAKRFPVDMSLAVAARSIGPPDAGRCFR